MTEHAIKLLKLELLHAKTVQRKIKVLGKFDNALAEIESQIAQAELDAAFDARGYPEGEEGS